jgi:lysozyme family protein
MADYVKSISKVLRREGALDAKLGYVNDKTDRGGETVAGIARNFHPSWGGWVVVDGHKAHPNFPKILKTDENLVQLIMSFYKREFWDKISGDEMKSQTIAELIIDTAVLEGFVPAIKRAENITGIPTTGKISELLIRKLNSL